MLLNFQEIFISVLTCKAHIFSWNPFVYFWYTYSNTYRKRRGWRSIKQLKKAMIRGWRPSTITPSMLLQELLLFTREFHSCLFFFFNFFFWVNCVFSLMGFVKDLKFRWIVVVLIMGFWDLCMKLNFEALVVWFLEYVFLSWFGLVAALFRF